MARLESIEDTHTQILVNMRDMTRQKTIFFFISYPLCFRYEDLASTPSAKEWNSRLIHLKAHIYPIPKKPVKTNMLKTLQNQNRQLLP